MMFAGEFGRELENKYVNNIEFEIIKGRKTKIETALKIATHSVYEVEVGVSLPDLEPVRVIGAYTHQEKGYTGEASYKKGDKIYRIFGEALYDPAKNYKFLLDFTVPSRRVKIATTMAQQKTEKRAMLDIQWNADIDQSERFNLNLTYDIKSLEDFEVVFSMYYPTRTIGVSLKHNTADRYITNVEVFWSPVEKVKFYIIFRDDIYNGANRTELDVGFQSPFKLYEDLKLSVSLNQNNKQIQSKSTVTWSKKKKIIVSTDVRLPVTKESTDIVGTISTPFEDYESLSVTIRHRLQNELQSSAIVAWGKNRFSIATNGDYNINPLSRTFNGNFELHTPYEDMRILVLKANHNDDYRNFKTSATVQKQVSTNTDEFKADLTFSLSDTIGSGRPTSLSTLNTVGTLQVKMPNDQIDTNWELSQQLGSTKILFDVQPMRKNRFKVQFEETHTILPTDHSVKAKFELEIPSQSVRELSVDFDHVYKPGSMKTKASIIKDNLQMVAATTDFTVSSSLFDLDVLLTSVYSEDVVLKVSHYHSIMPYRGNFRLSWGDTPWKITGESELFYNNFGHHDATLKLFSPIPGANAITVTSKRQRNGLNWETSTKLNFNRQSVSANILYRFDHVKFTQISIKSSFPQFPGLTTSFKLDGTQHNFNGETAFEMVPYVPKILSDFNWSYYEGSRISGSFNLNTQFPQYPYMKTSFVSDMLGSSRLSNFSLEYLPTQIIKIDLNNRFSSAETMEGTLTVTSPFTENKEVVAVFTHIGNMKKFNTKATITSDYIKAPVVTEARFASQNGAVVFFTMKSPFRGYEFVELNLDHKNTDTGYHTKAKYETNGKSIEYENLLKHEKSGLEWQITFLTPFANITRTHFKINHKGEFPNTNTRAEVAYNENMITSDFNLSHDDLMSKASAVVTTPFERYKNIRMTVSKQGSLSDFSATAECEYSLKWHASMSHKFTPGEIHTSALLKSPYLPDDVSLAVNYTGTPTDFKAYLDYVLNPNYRTVGLAQYKYNYPNVLASAKTTTTIDNVAKVNEVLLKHMQEVDEEKGKFDISSQFLADVRDTKVNLDLAFNLDENDSGKKLRTQVILELPHPDFRFSRMQYDVEGDYSDKKITTSQKSKFILETPLLETVQHTAEMTLNMEEFRYHSMDKYMYGDQVATSEVTYTKGQVVYEYVTPLEGYETTKLVINYDHPTVQAAVQEKLPLKSFSIDGTLNGSWIPKSVTFYGKGSRENDRDTDQISELDIDTKISYGDSEVFGFKMNGQPKAAGGRLAFVTDQDLDIYAYEWKAKYGDIEDMQYSVNGNKGSYVTYIAKTKLKSAKNFDIAHVFSSSFEELTNLEFNVKNVKIGQDYRPIMKVGVVTNGEAKNIEIDSDIGYDIKDLTNMKVLGGFGIKTTFTELQDLRLKIHHEHGIAPFSIKDIAVVSFNNQKYLDLDAAFGAQNRMTGLISFTAPQEMAFSFDGLNEGESVKAKLDLNWNKANPDSQFQMEFDFNTKDASSQEKHFSVKFVRPSRTVSFSTHDTRSNGRIENSLSLYWDEEKGQGVVYVSDYTWHNIAGTQTHAADVSLELPMRKLETTLKTIHRGETIQTFYYLAVLSYFVLTE